MNQKVIFRSVFVLAVAVGLTSVAVRTPKEVAPPRSPRPADAAAPDPSDRALSGYRLQEEGIVGGMDYRGAGFTSRVSESGFQFGAANASIQFAAPRISQGQRTLECSAAAFSRPKFGLAQIDRGIVQEAYYYENSRVEQTFTFPTEVGTGDLTIRIPVTKTLTGPVVAYSPFEKGLKPLQFQKGGLSFRDATGETGISYHSAVVIDAKGGELAIAPRYENGEIVLQVPGAWMEQATYPVVVDPWLELNDSASGGGISKTSSVSDRPSLAIDPSGNAFLAWSDIGANGSYEVFVRFWNGFEFRELAGSGSAGGISVNTGASLSPNICVDGAGIPMVCWLDNSQERVGVFVKRYNGKTAIWEELSLSASFGGLAATLAGPALNPKIVAVRSFVNNPTFPFTEWKPMVIWEEAFGVHAVWHYTGDSQATPGQVGWYTVGQGPDDTVNSATVGAAGAPSVTRDSLHRPVAAFQDTQALVHDIYLARLQNTAFPAQTLTLTGFPNFVTGARAFNAGTGFFQFNTVAWTGVDGSDLSGGLSGTATFFSQFPSVACDGTNITVAWEETETSGPTGTNTEIYLRRNTGAGWTALGSSVSAGGISNTVGHSTHPSLDVSTNGTICVAWVDDTNGNPDIYVRQWRTGVPSTAWEQVGDQGSAFPQFGGDVIFQSGGISQTSNISLTPTLKVDRFGSPTVVWMDGNSGKFDVFLKMFSPNAPGFLTGTDFTVQLIQSDTLTLSTIPTGSSTQATSVNFSANVYSETLLNPTGQSLELQVEVVKVGSPFTGFPTPPTITLPGGPNTTSSIVVGGLPNGVYKWQGRTIDQFGRFSPWLTFSGNSTSFQIDTNGGGIGGGPIGGGGGGGGGGPPAGGTGGTKSKCGLTGLEGFLVLFLLRRRIRS